MDPFCLPDAYKALGIQPSADEQTIKKAYRDLAKRYHPDVNPDDPGAEAHFKKIQWAYDLLKEEREINSVDDRWRDNMNKGFAMSEGMHPFFGFHEALKRSGWLKNNSFLQHPLSLPKNGVSSGVDEGGEAGEFSSPLWRVI